MRSAVLLSLALVLLGWPGAAAAGTARVEAGTLIYEAGAGEVNDVVVAYFAVASQTGVAEYRIGEVARIRYPQPDITPLAGCRTHTSDPPHIAACPAEGVSRIVIELGDGGDRVRTLGDYRDDPDRGCDPALVYTGDNIPVPLTFNGGSGDDELFEGPYMIIGPPLIGPQRCTLPRGPRTHVTSYGGAGDDLIVNAMNGYGGSGADSIEAPNSRRSRQEGGAGGDVLLGGSGADALDGAGGDDVVDGGPGDDSIAGGPGGDLGEGGAGDDVLLGGPGADELNGLQGNDWIVGGPGGDILEGDAGADLLDARDGRADGISGGAGRDRARSDRRDRLRDVERH